MRQKKYQISPVSELEKRMLLNAMKDYNKQNVITAETVFKSAPITGEAVIAHRELVDKINTYFPGKSIERTVLENKKLDCLGMTVRELNGTTKIIIRSDVASMNITDDLKKIQKHNKQKITPKDFFQYVLSHEYGHILTGSLDNNLLCKAYLAEKEFTPISDEADEAFAIWFGSAMTGIKRQISFFENEYCYRSSKHDPLKFHRINHTYKKLTEFHDRHGIDEMFKTKNIVRILY